MKADLPVQVERMVFAIRCDHERVDVEALAREAGGVMEQTAADALPPPVGMGVDLLVSTEAASHAQHPERCDEPPVLRARADPESVAGCDGALVARKLPALELAVALDAFACRHLGIRGDRQVDHVARLHREVDLHGLDT